MWRLGYRTILRKVSEGSRWRVTWDVGVLDENTSSRQLPPKFLEGYPDLPVGLPSITRTQTSHSVSLELQSRRTGRRRVYYSRKYWVPLLWPEVVLRETKSEPFGTHPDFVLVSGHHHNPFIQYSTPAPLLWLQNDTHVFYFATDFKVLVSGSQVFTKTASVWSTELILRRLPSFS